MADDNARYRSREGVLFTADNTLLYYPRQKADEAYAVPEGTLRIGSGAFDSCYFAPAEVTLPDSVLDVGNLGKDGYDEPCPYKVHCREGTEAQKQLGAMGVEWVEIRD